MTITRAEIDDLNDGDMVTVAGWQGLRVSGPVSVTPLGDKWMGNYLRLSYPKDCENDWTQERGSTLLIIKRAEVKPPPLYVNHPAKVYSPGDVVTRESSESVWMRTTDDRWIDWDGESWGVLAGPLTLVFDGAKHEVVQ